MHPIQVKFHHWFVPYRLVWDNWREFITGGNDGFTLDTFRSGELDNSMRFPTLTNLDSTKKGSIHDYFGIPVGCTGGFSALPFRAYNLIWNEFYRDEQLSKSVPFTSKDSGDSPYELLPVAWKKDYFTTARPDDQCFKPSWFLV